MQQLGHQSSHSSTADTSQAAVRPQSGTAVLRTRVTGNRQVAVGPQRHPGHESSASQATVKHESGRSQAGARQEQSDMSWTAKRYAPRHHGHESRRSQTGVKQRKNAIAPLPPDPRKQPEREPELRESFREKEALQDGIMPIFLYPFP